MATVKTKKKTSLYESLKPIVYTKVSEPTQNESVASKLKTAGEVANASYKMENDDKTVEFMPVKPNLEEEVKQETPSAVVRDVNSVDDLFGAFSDIDKKFENISDADYYPKDAFDNALPDSLDLKKYDVPEIDEEKLKQEITKAETGKNEAEKNTLKQQTQIKTQAKEKEIETLKQESEREKSDIQEIYDDYKVNVESDAIKRGLARSSVAILSMDNLEASRAKELSRVAENLTKSITEVESEILALQQNLELSLNNLDLELAQNINTQLKSRIDELEKKQREAIKFNNEVEELQTNYKIKIQNNENTKENIEKRLQEEYFGVADEDKKGQKLDLAINYFKTLNKSDALKIIINSSDLASALGEDYYTLYYYIMRG